MIIEASCRQLIILKSLSISQLPTFLSCKHGRKIKDPDTCFRETFKCALVNKEIKHSTVEANLKDNTRCRKRTCWRCEVQQIYRYEESVPTSQTRIGGLVAGKCDTTLIKPHSKPHLHTSPTRQWFTHSRIKFQAIVSN